MMFTYFRRKTFNVEAHDIPHVLTYPSHIVEVTISPSYPRYVGFYTSKTSKDVLSQSIMTFAKKVGGLKHEFYFSIQLGMS